MSLRTYPLITHPAFLRFVEDGGADPSYLTLPPAEVPFHLPKIARPYDLASYLGVNPLMVRSFVKNKEKHYRSFPVKKRSGEERIIDAPRTFLKVMQWWILDSILETRSDLPMVFGFSRGRSYLENARQHIGARHILNVDIKNFFPSISIEMVYRVFEEFGYNDKVAEFLSEICTYGGILPQGAPSSPKLSNFVFGDCDLDLQNLAIAHNAKFTRYADDITFSSLYRIPEDVLTETYAICERRGFRLNDRKTRFMGPNQVKEVTGLILTQNGIGFSRDYLNGLRGWFHSIQQQPEFRQSKIDSLKGTVELLRQVGGRGTPKLIDEGRKAIRALEAVSIPEMKW